MCTRMIFLTLYSNQTERQPGDKIIYAKSKFENNEESQIEEVVHVRVAPAKHELGVIQDVQMNDTTQLEMNYDASDTITGVRFTSQNRSPLTLIQHTETPFRLGLVWT